MVCQTLVRVCGSPHAETNAAILPRATAFLAARAPADRLAALAAAIGTDPARSNRGSSSSAATRRASARSAPTVAKLDEALDAILARPELAFTPDPPDRERAGGVDRERLVTAR